MKKLLVLVMMMCAFLFAACGSSNLDRLNGSWTLTVDMGDEEDAMAVALASAILGSFVMEFDTKAMTMAVKVGNRSERTTFKVESDSGNTLVLLNEDGDQSIFEFIDDDTIRVQDDGASAGAVLKRVK